MGDGLLMGDSGGEGRRLIRDCTLFFGCFLAGMLAVVMETWVFGFGWYDQQRVFQIFFLILAVLFVLMSRSRLPSAVACRPVLVFFLLGLLSSFFSAYPIYAAKEWAVYFGLFCLMLAAARCGDAPGIRDGLILGLGLIVVINAWQFLVLYIMAFVTGVHDIDADVLFVGFSNPRFLNQFQGLCMPLMSLLVLQAWKWWGQKSRGYLLALVVVFFLALAVQWCIALTLGGRSLWVGMVTSSLILLISFRKFWRLLAVQVAALLCGLVLFAVLFHVIPEWIGLSPKLRETLRMTSSGRIDLWREVLGIYLENLWLGVGPMHLAAEWHLRVAHAHQGILQLLAEWGTPATLIVLYLFGKGMLHGWRQVRTDKAEYIDAALWLSLATSLVMAQFEGVLSMPYTQMWLAVLAGLALSRWSAQPAPGQASGVVTTWLGHVQGHAFRLMAVAVMVILGAVLAFEVPTLPKDSQAHMERHHSGWVPRFWLQGWIPMDP